MFLIQSQPLQKSFPPSLLFYQPLLLNVFLSFLHPISESRLLTAEIELFCTSSIFPYPKYPCCRQPESSCGLQGCFLHRHQSGSSHTNFCPCSTIIVFVSVKCWEDLHWTWVSWALNTSRAILGLSRVWSIMGWGVRRSAPTVFRKVTEHED